MAELDAIFVNIESKALARVTGVDDAYAYLAITNRDGRTSHYAMPIAEYDSDRTVPEHRRFSSIWRPATVADLGGGDLPATFRPPKGEPEAVEVAEPARLTEDASYRSLVDEPDDPEDKVAVIQTAPGASIGDHLEALRSVHEQDEATETP